MTEHNEAVEHFKWLRKYCNEHTTDNKGCPTCIFYNEIMLNDKPYGECVADGFKCIESVYQREVLPIVEKNLTKLVGSEVAE